MSSAQSDRNLLFGILAVQMDFIGGDELLAAMHAWVLDKSQPLGQILEERGALSGPHRAALEGLVQAHLERHGNDTQRSLAAVGSVEEVRREVGRITDADVQASLSRVPATRADSGLTGPYAPAALPPSSRFRPLRPLASGGLGHVSVALDGELRREVALKEIRPEHAGHADSRARFLLEAEVTGGLEHPGVVPVYGLGQYPDGRTYYAMRLIRGESLREAVQRYHKEKAALPVSERGLRLRQLLTRFVAVCNAVAYAHSRGVLHRDLKPANVMVGRYGETLVVDWGLAKVLAGDAESTEGALRPSLSGDPTATQPGAALGTPAYMPPEQAAGRLDLLGPRSDVYSLGATLYSLLTGRSPLTHSDTAEVLRRAQRGEFPRPREAAPDTPAALEAVCLKAMALRPEGRYGSAQELAADVERWLADEPVRAFREPLPARLARWARRHRASVMSGAAALVVLAVSLGVLAAVLSSHNSALAAANARESVALGREREARERAQSNFRLARQAVKDYCVAISLDPRLKQADFADLRKELLATAARFHERFKDQEGDDPDVRSERAYAYFELASIADVTGAKEKALGYFRRSLDLWVPLVEAHPDNREYRRGLAYCYNDAANLYASLGRAEDAEEAYRRSLALRQGLADSAPADAAAQDDLAMAYGNMALWLAGRKRFQEAEGHYGKALRMYQELVDAHPKNAGYLRHLADQRHKLSYLHSQTGRRTQALEGYREAAALRERLNQEHPGDPRCQEDLGWSHFNLGLWYREAGEYGKAAEEARQAVDAYQAVADARPSVPNHQYHLANFLAYLGSNYRASGKFQQALEAHRRAAAVAERLSKLYPKDFRYARSLGGGYCNVGEVLREAGQPQAAMEWLDKARDRLEEVRGRNARDGSAQAFLSDTYRNRAEALLALDRPAEALGEWDLALALVSTDRERAPLQMGRARALARLGRVGEAALRVEEQLGRAAADPEVLYAAAEFYSVASAASGRGATPGAGERQEVGEKDAARAVSLLRQAQAKGYFKKSLNVTYLGQDRDLHPLRQRPDFRQLLKELETAPAP